MVRFDDYRMRLQQETQQASSRRGCWRNNNCPEISITRMEVRGEAAKILKLRNSPRIERVNIHAELMQRRSTQQQKLEAKHNINQTDVRNKQYSSQTIDPRTWVPTDGKVSSPGRSWCTTRYIYFINEFPGIELPKLNCFSRTTS